MSSYNIGLNVVEVDGSGAPAIVGASTSVSGFNILTQRGVPNRPTRISSFPQFVEQFGSFFAGGLGAYLVKGFFDNGGRTAYINRVVSNDPLTGATPATITLLDSAGPAVNTLRLDTAFRGVEDPGDWGNDIYVQVAAAQTATVRIREIALATVQGTPLAAQTDMTTFPTLSVLVDGETVATNLTFQASDFANPAQATRTEIRDAVNRRQVKLTASLSVDDRLVLTSNGSVAQMRGVFSSLQVSVANATLGFPAAAGAPTMGTPAPRTATSTRLAKVDDFQVGDAILFTDGALTNRAKILTIVPATGEVTWLPAAANFTTYNAFLTTFQKVEFDLTIAKGGSQSENIVETWPGLSMEVDASNYAPSVLNDSIYGSRYLMATNLNSASPAGVDVPAALAFTRLNPGQNGTPIAADFIGDSAAHTGFYAFDAYDVQLLTSERTDAAIVTTALAYCAGRGDCMYVGAVPESFVAAGQAVTYGKGFQGKKVYGALYGPWIKIFDPIGSGSTPVKWVPPVGHVLGVYARIDASRGIWKAPAGDEATVMGALDVEYRLSDAEHTDLVKNGSVNGIRVVPRLGIVVDASRTLSTDTRWLYVNVRLLFNYVKGSLKQGLSWVRQEPNRDTLWNAVKFNSVNPFLMGLWRQGAFGTGTPTQVFTVICDASNNPPDQVDQGNFKIEVYFYPSKPAETIIIIVGQQPSGASASEA
jgi:phage tail sheath protein FI